jgi:hypothetical protein
MLKVTLNGFLLVILVVWKDIFLYFMVNKVVKYNITAEL